MWGVRGIGLKRLLWLAELGALIGCGSGTTPPTTNRVEPQLSALRATQGTRYDLAADEGRGGHTLRNHVGRTDLELQERLRLEPYLSAASTWTDRETAEVTVAEALRAERKRVERWMQQGYPRSNLALHYNAGRILGRTLGRDAEQAVPCTTAVIVLRADGPSSYFVLTAYPEASE